MNLRSLSRPRLLAAFPLVIAALAPIAVTGCQRSPERPTPGLASVEHREFPPRPEGALNLAIAYTGNARGEIFDCGCSQDPLGGLARRAALLKKLREANPGLLYVDYGEAFFPGNWVGESEVDETVKRAKLIIESLDQMDLDAYTPGALDFILGSARLQELLSGARFATVSANLLHPIEDGPLFPPYALFSINGVRVAVTGVTPDFGDDVVWPTRGEVRFADPVSSVRDVVARVGDRVDRIVVLSRVREAARDEIARIDGVDFIIGWPDGFGTGTPKALGNAWIAASTDRGRHLGVLSTELLPDRSGFAQDLDISGTERMIAQYENWLRDSVGKKPAEVEAVRKQLTELEARLERARAANPLKTEQIPLNLAMPEDPEINGLIAKTLGTNAYR